MDTNKYIGNNISGAYAIQLAQKDGWKQDENYINWGAGEYVELKFYRNNHTERLRIILSDKKGLFNGNNPDIFSKLKVEDIKYKKVTNESKMKKNTIKLTESRLNRIISESIKKVLKENNDINPVWMRAYGLLQNVLIELVETYNVEPSVAMEEMKSVLKTYDADDLYDDGNEDFE